MKPNFKAILAVCLSACLVAAALCGCTKTGTSRAPGNNMGQATAQNDRYGMVNATTQNYDGNGNMAGNNYGTGGNYTNQPGLGNGLTDNAVTGTGIDRVTGKKDIFGMAGATGTTGTAGINGMNGTNGVNGMNGTLNQQAANNIEARLKGIKGIYNVNCIVLGDTALVCYSSDRNTTALENSIKQKVKAADSSITNVVCTTDRNIAARMSRLGSGTGTNGGTNNGIGNDIATEFKNIINSLTKPTTR